MYHFWFNYLFLLLSMHPILIVFVYVVIFYSMGDTVDATPLKVIMEMQTILTSARWQKRKTQALFSYGDTKLAILCETNCFFETAWNQWRDFSTPGEHKAKKSCIKVNRKVYCICPPYLFPSLVQCGVIDEKTTNSQLLPQE